jgi:FkbM family methyltransferase
MDGTLKLQFADRVLNFTYPESGNAGLHISNILQGKDYPILKIDGYQPNIIIDVGANVGAATFFFMNNYPNAEYYCYEPSLSNYRYLQKNIEGCTNVHTFNFGLSNDSKHVRLYLGNSQCLQNSVIPSIEVTEKFEDVELRSANSELGKIIRDKCILKIDTEGCELPILKDIEDHLKKVDIVYLEYHSESDRIALEQLLNPGFSLWYASATMIHRGNSGYLSKKLIEGSPELAQWDIKH